MREKPDMFDELTCILLQQERRMNNFNFGSTSSNLALLVKEKQPYKGKPWDKNKGGIFQGKQKGIAQSKFESYVKKNDECFY